MKSTMMQEPAPKGMVRTEMGRLVKKADQDAWNKSVTESMNDQYFNRAKDAEKARAMEAAKARAMKLGSMKKKSFPDLNKDGKITKADILKGRGVIK
jgi:hypothetical protein